MRPRHLLARLAATALLAAAPLHAIAAPVTYAFTGTVDDDEASRGYAGFAGSFTFDSASTDAIADASTAAYAHAGAPWGMTLAFDGGPAFTVADSFNVLVSNDLLGMDQWGLLAQDAAQSISMTLTDLAGLVFSSDALPGGGLTMAAFNASLLRWETTAGALQGRVATLACSAGCDAATGGGGGGGGLPVNHVPEPSTALLAALGLAVMLRRQQQRPA